MSAFMCSDEHVNRILDAAVSAAGTERSSLMHLPIMDSEMSLNEGLTKAGRMLLIENLASMRARYTLPVNEVLGYHQQIESFVYVKGGEAQTLVSPVQGLRLAASWRYQSCEHPEEARDKATWDLLYGLERLMIAALPGYDAADWSV